MSSQTLEHRGRTSKARRSWHMPWLETLAAFLILAGTMTVMYPSTASWFSQREQSRVTEMALNKLESPPSNSALFRREQIEQAHKYNKALSSGAVYRANENVAQGDGSVSDGSMVYEDLLNITDSGFMGRIRYDALKIDLPIYHGTSDETLLRGVGHLEGTSLPVGGLETRSVLTAHRGLPESTLFTNLNDAAVGDRFTVSVLDQTLTYEVIEMLVIEPDETEAILPVANTDMLTLITCTPLGINSHRILVNAVRVTPTPIADEAAAAAAPDLPGFPWWAVILGGVLLGAVLFIWRSGYAHASRLARAKSRAGLDESTNVHDDAGEAQSRALRSEPGRNQVQDE